MIGKLMALFLQPNISESEKYMYSKGSLVSSFRGKGNKFRQTKYFLHWPVLQVKCFNFNHLIKVESEYGNGLPTYYKFAETAIPDY